MAEHVPDSHPKSDSLEVRYRLEACVEKGVTSPQGLISHGRGEAIDYFLGKDTIESAREAERVAAAQLLLADHPVISINGNAAALAPEGLVKLADIVGADIEVNLFNRTEERMEAVAEHLREHGATEVKGLKGDAEIPGISRLGARATVDSDGIYDADVVLVPIEDGDRCKELTKLGKTEIVIDLNPLSRTSKTAHVPIVDEVTRAVPNVIEFAEQLREKDEAELQRIVDAFDADRALADAEQTIREGWKE